jgi:predicted phage terminase large subunit-like protein
LTTTKTIRLHRAQAAFRRSRALYRGFVGGRGAGKSWVGAYDVIRRAKRGRTYLVASPTSVLMQDTTFPTLKAIGQDLGVWGDVRMTPYPTVQLTTGATLRFRTAEDPDKMRGPNLSGVWLDEASLMHEDAYKIAIACLRECGEQGWLSATFTPKGMTHWTYEVFGKSKPNTELFRAKTKANPFLPPDFYATLKDQYAPTLAIQELDGEFCDMEGAEFPAAWFGDHIWVQSFPTDLALRVLYLDPSVGAHARKGDYSAFVLMGRGHAGTLYVEADLQRRPMTQCVADGIAIARRFAPLDRFGVETNAFQLLMADEFARQSKAVGIMLPVWPVVNSTPKDVRIRRLTPYLSRSNVRFVDTPGTRLLVAQLREWPLGTHDDGPDAMEGALRCAIELYNGRRKGGAK